MKTLKRLHLAELERIMPTLDTIEQSAIFGGDKFCFNTSGYCYNIIEDDGPDEIYVDGAKSGYILESGKLNVSGTMTKGKSGTRITGGNKNLFKYLSNNTEVEWGMSYNDIGENPDGIIDTNYSTGGVEFQPIEGYDTYIHSHPGGTPTASDLDNEIKSTYTGHGRYAEKYNYKKFQIYGRDERGNEFENTI